MAFTDRHGSFNCKEKQEDMGLFLYFAKTPGNGRSGKVHGFLLTALLLGATLFTQVNASLAADIYDSQILQRMSFSGSQHAKVRAILSESDREMAAIFRKYGIDPNAKPEFDKLQSASGELQAMESREKRAMKEILTKQQYKTYLQLLQETSARVIKATRTDP